MQSHQCTECNKELRQVPAGVSRNTGKPYKAFWACPDRHKQEPQQEQPQQPQNGSKNAALEMIYRLDEILAEIKGLRQDLKKDKVGEWPE